MHKHLRHSIASAFLLLPAAATLVALPSAAIAQPAAAQVESLAVTADAGLEPGSRLGFRLIGTPRVQGSIRIRGLRESIPLREVQPGVYVGRYTLKRTDRVAPDSEVRAMLRRGNRTEVATYALSETMEAPRVVVVPPPAPRLPDPRIERFGISPLERVEPGADIRFALEGTPGGTVIVDLPGVQDDLRLREVRPGFYEGNYTIRRADNFNPNRPIVATLRVGDRVSTTNVPLPIAAAAPAVDNRPPNLVNLFPRDGETVPPGPVQISAGFEDRGGTGVDPASVEIHLSGRNVTREAQINSQSFSLRAALPPGRHVVDVSARDRAGNAVRRSWSFEVAGAVVVPAPVNVGVQVLNHGHNGQVGVGPTLVQARTAPNASVAVSVHAVAPTGGTVNISQNLFQQTLQADADGNFNFSFVPQIPIPGTRYDIVMVSSRGNASQETRMTLFQR